MTAIFKSGTVIGRRVKVAFQRHATAIWIRNLRLSVAIQVSDKP